MRVKVVTSISSPLWHTYASKCIATWVEHFNLDKGSEIEIWVSGPFPTGIPVTTRHGTPIHYKSIDVQSEAWKNFHTNFKNQPVPETPENERYKFRFMPFSIKVFALAESAVLTKEDKHKFDAMLWLDADVLLKQEVTSEYLRGVLGDSTLAWLPRGAKWNYCGETGFILAKNGQTLDIFLTQANIWGCGQLFYFKEWHDAFTFSSLACYQEYTDPEHFVLKSLNDDIEGNIENGLYPFKTGVLNTHFEHLKGPLKGNA